MKNQIFDLQLPKFGQKSTESLNFDKFWHIQTFNNQNLE